MNDAAQNFSGDTRTAETIPLPHLTKQKIKDAIVALSLANLCFIRISFNLLSDHHRYFESQPVTPLMLLALALNIFCFAFVFWVAMQALRRFHNNLFHLAVHLLFFAVLLFPVDYIRSEYLFITDAHIVALLKQPVMILCGLVLLALVIWQHRLVARIVAVFVGILSPLAFFLLLKMLLVCLGVVHLKQGSNPTASPPLYPVRAGQPRIVWIIFDETDYRLAFEQRPAGLQLPEFDRLQNESLSASKAYSPGDYTLLSMPQLITGRRFSSVSAADTLDLLVTLDDTGETTDWGKLPSVFSDARALGVNTALVGWYHPYGRIFGSSLNFCAWYPFPLFQPARVTAFGTEIRQQIESLSGTLYIRRLLIDGYLYSLKASLSVVTNSTYGLTLLHLMPPHRPGIYLPDKNQFTVFGMPKTTGYFNNLALADHTLGMLRQAMEQSGEWDKTWVIMSTDHSWRESKLYDGKRDMRVPFLVKPPGDNESLTYSRQFNTILTHDLILAILRNEVTNQQNVVTWIDAHGKLFIPVPVVYPE